MTKLASKAGIDIHRRLAAGQSPVSIAEETGMGLSSVYYHRQRKCVCDKAQAPERSVDIGDDLLVELAELEKILFPDGVPAPTQAVTPPLPPVPTMADALASGMGKSWAEAVLKFWTENPGAWAKDVAEARADAAKAQAKADKKMQAEARKGR